MVEYYWYVSFSHQCLLMVFYLGLSDCKSPQITKTLLANLNKAVIWMILILPLISTSCSFFQTFSDHSKHTNCNCSHHHSYFSGNVQVFPHYFCFLIFFFFYLVVSQDRQNPQVDYFFFSSLSTRALAFWPGLGDLFALPNPRKFYQSHSVGWILICIYTICYYGQILISTPFPSRSPSPPCYA